MSKNIILVDSLDTSSIENTMIYTWNGYEEKEGIYSLLKYIEQNSERLRKMYLSWIHDLGETKINNKSVIEHLIYKNGLSYWWMTLFVEKSIYKSPISSAIRLLAFEDILRLRKPDRVKLVSSNKILHKTIKELCKKMNIPFDAQLTRIDNKYTIRTFYNHLPFVVRAVLSMARYLYYRWIFKNNFRVKWKTDHKSLFFMTYFFNIEESAANEGRFVSQYWGGINKIANELGCSCNWLHMYVPHKKYRNSNIANNLLQRFNSDKESHMLLESYISWKTIAKSFNGLIILYIRYFRLLGIKKRFIVKKSNLSFWYLMKDDWKNSLFGPSALNNLLWVELFQEALSTMPNQKIGFYLCENQGWERAFINAWKVNNHGCLYAVPHSTVRFWDLRQFSDLRTIENKTENSIPQPDYTIMNGDAAKNAYLSSGFPKRKVVEGEALRYNYISENNISRIQERAETKILILGDYLSSVTDKMVNLVYDISGSLNDRVSFSIKPHPNYSIDITNYTDWNVDIISSPISSVLDDYDVAISSFLTSAAVDSYLANLKVIVILDETELNLSPLRGCAGVRFISCEKELLETLNGKEILNSAENSDYKYFYTDSKLSKWKDIINTGLSCSVLHK